MAIQLTPEDRALIEKDSDLSNREIALQVKNLTISFRTDNGKVQAVRGVSFDLYRGETLCIVGESGSGKSVTSKAIMGILSPNAIIEGGSILYNGIDLTKASEAEFQRLRGKKIGMIFQDPLSSLNPIVRIGKQITETMMINKDMLKRYFDDLVAPALTAYMNARSARDNAIADAKAKASMPMNGYEDKLASFRDAKATLREKIALARKNKEPLDDLKAEGARIAAEEKAFAEENKRYLAHEAAEAKKAIAQISRYVSSYEAQRQEYFGKVFYVDKPVSTFRPSDARVTRDLTKVHPHEIVAAAKCAIEATVYIEKDDLNKEVFKLFNVAKRTKSAVEWVDAALSAAVQTGEIIVTPDGFCRI